LDTSSSRKKNWNLTQEAFDLLLAHLDSDRERAGEKYLILRLKLERYFEWRGCLYPEDHTDETINRVCRRLSEGEVVTDIANYAYGVARLLLLEILKERQRERTALEQLPPSAEPADESQQQSRLECFESCLVELSNEDRNLIVNYYRGEKGEKIQNRKQLAEAEGIPLNALRIRTHRIRERLEQCIKKSLNRLRAK
jgi:DNA-directed RNA polymerase specialized sigma24 family protein